MPTTKAIQKQEILPSKLEERTAKIFIEANQIKVESPADYGLAATFLRSIKLLRDEIGSWWNPVIKKAHEAHKEAIFRQRKFTDALDSAENAIKQKMLAYATIEENERKAAESKINQNANEKGALAPLVLPSQLPQIEGISLRSTWSFEIVNEGDIPREYLSPDIAKIRGVVMALKCQACIPGIRVFEKQGIAVNTK